MVTGPRPLALRASACALIGGMIGVLIWRVILGQMGLSLAHPFQHNTDRLGDSAPGAYVELVKRSVFLAPLVACALAWRPFSVGPTVACVLQEPRPSSRMIMVSSVLFLALTGALQLVIPAVDRYIFKAAPAVILLTCHLLLGRSPELPLRLRWVLTSTTTIVLVLVPFLDVRGLVPRWAGLALVALAGVTWRARNRGWRGLVVPLALLLAGTAFAQYWQSWRAVTYDADAVDMREARLAGEWVDRHVPPGSRVAVLQRPAQIFIRLPHDVVLGSTVQQAEIERVLAEAEYVVGGRKMWATRAERARPYAGVMEEALEKQYQVVSDEPAFLVWRRR